jgi:hypothetical protein
VQPVSAATANIDTQAATVIEWVAYLFIATMAAVIVIAFRWRRAGGCTCK